VGNFGGLAAWQPAVAHCELRPAAARPAQPVRHLRMTGGESVVENLVALDQQRMSLTYEIVSSPYPLRFYRSTMAVFPLTTTGEAFVGWSVEFECDPADTHELTLSFRDGIFGGGLRGLRDLIGAGQPVD
jgi:hypothetical protein